MIADRISTALVLESDADWDMRVHEIMTGIAKGVPKLVDWPFNPSNETDPRIGEPLDPSPYGDNWDVIWMGHCGSYNHGYGRQYNFNDTSVPPESREYSFAAKPQDEQHRPGTRMVYEIGGTVCSTGYAVSYAGAVKLVEYFKQGQDNLDLMLMWLCDHKTDLTCLGVWPQVITAAVSHSNIEHPNGEIATGVDPDNKEVIAVAGPGLQYSARINAAIVKQYGHSPEHWHPEWNSTWAMVRDEWKEVSFDEARELEEVQKWENQGADGNTTTKGTRSW